MKVKEESEKFDLQLNIQKTKIMAFSPITSWQIDGGTMVTVKDYFLGFQNHCRWWLQPWNWKILTPWQKSYDQPRQHIKKQRHYFTVKGLVFPVVMYDVRVGPSGRLSTEVLMLLTVVLEKILDSPLDCKEIKPVSSRKSVLNIHWKDWCWISNTLYTWWEEPTHWKRPWCSERLKVEGEGDDRGWEGWRTSPTRWTWIWTSSRSWWRSGKVAVLQSMGLQKVIHDWVTTGTEN